MKTTFYYGITRHIYKNNQSIPCESTIYSTIYKTEEEAVKAMLKEADHDCLFYHYQPIIEQHQGWYTKALQTVHNSKTGKDTIYRHEWSIKVYSMEEEQ